MKVPYRGWDSLVHPLANCLMKCQISKCTCSPSHWAAYNTYEYMQSIPCACVAKSCSVYLTWYFERPLREQQFLSVFKSSGGSCSASLYWHINPSAIFWRDWLPSDSASTETTTSRLSFPTLVAQLAVFAAHPCSFLQIFFVESIF